MYNVSFFKTELSWIELPSLQFTTKTALENAPAWFWTAPSSSSGKYHPPDSNGEGGNVRHCAKVTWLGYKYAECFGVDPDPIVVAGLLHDYRKFGVGDKMDFADYKQHAELGADTLQRRFAEFSKEADQLHPDELRNKWDAACSLIRSHMGRWGTVQAYTLEQKLLHIADVTAAYKELVAVKFYDPGRPTGAVRESDGKYRYFREEGDDLVINFGNKHRGRTVDEVIEHFPDYVQWALNEDFDNEDFDEEVKRVFNEAMGITAKVDKPKASAGRMPSFGDV